MKSIILVIIISIGLGAISGSLYSNEIVRVGNDYYEANGKRGLIYIKEGFSVYNKFNTVVGIKVFGLSMILGGAGLLIAEVIRKRKE